MATEPSARITMQQVSLREISTEPLDPAQDVEIKIFVKSDSIVFMFNDGGTVRYKYLDMNGTGVTWVHSTTPP